METAEIQKTEWGDGPWLTEPEEVSFTHAGLACQALRNPLMGFWCGYCSVPPGHPANGKPYEDVDVDVHGGLTFAQPGPDGRWVLGFDCGHCWDLAPAMAARERKLGMRAIAPETYRDLAYVRSQLESLAEQLAAAPPKGSAEGDDLPEAR